MPFGTRCEYPDFEACVRDNQDKKDPSGYCAALQRATEDRCATVRETSTIGCPDGETAD